MQKFADRLSHRAQDFRLELGDPCLRGYLREVLAVCLIQLALLVLDVAI